jgi:hypothetical protein
VSARPDFHDDDLAAEADDLRDQDNWRPDPKDLA